jgi:hypothetical protein
MAALDHDHDRDSDPDAALYDGNPVEIRTEHNPDQTVIAVENDVIEVVAAVSAGELALANELTLAREVRAAVERATTGRDTPPAPGGDDR